MADGGCKVSVEGCNVSLKGYKVPGVGGHYLAGVHG